MELRGIRGLWLATVCRFRGVSPDSATLHPGYAGYAGYAGSIKFRQSGAALITSLIFLTILTILGMSSLGTALLESRMAGNARDRNIAFQAAEMGLRDAELYIRDSGRIVGVNEEGYNTTATCAPTTGNCDGQTCLYGLCYNGGSMEVNTSAPAWYEADEAVWQDEAKWANAVQYAHGSATAGVTGGTKKFGYAGTTPVLTFNINCGQIPGNCLYSQPAQLPLVRRQPEYLIEAYEKNVGGLRYYYRITVRGYGMRTGTRVMVQEVYTP
ncbi:MAG: PilX N-terminal domain-containing pilus assembly protein [Pseudomonadota bacterium]|nr:PilX N-terminal domain-containing pilus assembly protein [Pseudomonadota bacterium]